MRLREAELERGRSMHCNTLHAMRGAKDAPEMTGLSIGISETGEHCWAAPGGCCGGLLFLCCPRWLRACPAGCRSLPACPFETPLTLCSLCRPLLPH